MFEKESKEYAIGLTYPNFQDNQIANIVLRDVEGGFQKGAELGYNKAKEDADKMKSRFLELCNLKDMRIAELEKVNEWHNPKEKLPTKDCEVLIEYDEHKTHRVVDWNNKSQRFGGFSIDEVTRWKEIE